MLKLFNTLTNKKEEFVPVREGEVGIYACGVTVYDLSHVGHARGAVIFDVIRNYLKHKGYHVNYARNFTDVDDKIIKRAAEEGITWQEVAEKYTQAYLDDMDALGVGRPDIEPRATEHIPEIIGIIKRLEENGYAYAAGGDVFFSVRKFKDYGKLSKKPLDDMMSGARVEVNEAKRDPLDFALWKASKEGEPSWDSPWGPGRPGWHIECSAMSTRHLGETFDIHGGGADLQFPHHENEIAQAEAATGKPFAKYWMHNGFVSVNREKMSKSLGNFFTIREVIEKYDPEAVRLFLLSTHYRNPIDFSDQSLKDAKNGLDRFYTMLEGLEAALDGHRPSAYDEAGLSPEALELHRAALAFREKFDEAMDDDFNTAAATGAVYELVREVNRTLSSAEPAGPDQGMKDVMAGARDALGHASGILGIFTRQPSEWFGRTQKTVELNVPADKMGEVADGLSGLGIELSEGEKPGITPEQIQKLIDMRTAARTDKDWARADLIRDILSTAGIELLDGAEGTKWQIRE